MSKILGAVSIIGGGYFLNQKYRLAPEYNFDFYNHIYTFISKNYRSELAQSMTNKLMGMNIFYTIDRDQYTQSLCGELAGVFLPNIIGLEEGNDVSARQLQSLFGVGLGFVEVGPLSSNTNLIGQSSNEQIEENILVGKAQLSSFKSRNFEESYKYPVGVNLQASQEIKEITPFLAEKEYEQNFGEIIDSCDYIVINFTKGYQIKHLLEPIKLQNFLSKLKEKRTYEIGVNSLLQHESKIIEKEKKQIGLIYGDEVLGTSNLNSEAFVPKIFIKLDEIEHKLPTIIELAKNYKQIGIEGFIIRTDNTSTISKVASLTQGEIPLIIASRIQNGEDLIKKVKKGAWAIQISKDYQEQGPHFVQDLLEDVRQELKKVNIKNITSLRGVDIF